MKTSPQISSLLLDIAEPTTSGTRAEWMRLFNDTQATNEPILLFADALRLGLLVEQEPGYFYFVEPGQTGLSEQKGERNE